MIYLDNSATTKPDMEVLNSFRQVAEQFYANPSSIHQIGGQSEKLLYKARTQAAQILHVAPEEIIFTSGGTEANNMAIKGVAAQYYNRGKHIIISEIEHPSVYDTCQTLEKFGFEITYLPVDKNGVVSVDDVEKAIREDTILISVMHVNNEIGSVQPIKEIGQVASKHPKLFFHVDNVQGFGKVPLDIKACQIDFCTISAHKIHGLRGNGILYMNKTKKLAPLLSGGNQEFGKRSGTENLAGIVSMVKAMRLIDRRQQAELMHLRKLGSYLYDKLQKMEGVELNSPMQPLGAPHIINFSAPGLKPEVVIHALGEKGIFISTKSACSSKQLDDSRIVAACGYDSQRSSSALRVSLSYENNQEEIDIFLKELKTAISYLKEVMG
ncbi:cysteine desulfurase family protein [Virgibacillus sp. 179-BFC.A HS]|uniref:Cysteine desulfurase family protein n=1 Tax=Tigheibacillus jepli TaxID=3035914 RepID=A0ABU5CIJ2_9BACI|nr:cysteine desulfurase family protein [Virgibacillus sp. 179-BFC.A HS]MDY0405325.1 cysteine desulfurase family protein [Virgibacillus sp. 179-BFC.A HS]